MAPVSVVLVPLQILKVPLILTVGVAVTVILTVFVFEQPLFVPVTV